VVVCDDALCCLSTNCTQSVAVCYDINTLRQTSTHCNRHQHTATDINTLQQTVCSAAHSLLQCVMTSTHCNRFTLQQTAHSLVQCVMTSTQHCCSVCTVLQCVMTSTHCNRHQHTATDCMQCCTQSVAVCYHVYYAFSLRTIWKMPKIMGSLNVIETSFLDFRML